MFLRYSERKSLEAALASTELLRINACSLRLDTSEHDLDSTLKWQMPLDRADLMLGDLTDESCCFPNTSRTTPPPRKGVRQFGIYKHSGAKLA
jgi:hypothetical protein